MDARGNPGAPPKTAADVVAKGDLVYVLPAGGEAAYLAQVPLVQGAFVSLDPQDGAITSLAGGFDFYHAEGGGKFNRAVQARRQPGSAFKPFIYSGALEAGFTPASVTAPRRRGLPRRRCPAATSEETAKAHSRGLARAAATTG